MSGPILALAGAVVWLGSTLVVLWWAAYRYRAVDEAKMIALYTLLGPVCFAVILASYFHFKILPRMRTRKQEGP